MRQIFWGFCINRFGIGPLHYVSSRSDFSFKFSEIFIIDIPRLIELGNQQVSTLHPWLLFCQIDLLKG